jgi:hypothetical protein
MKPDSSILWDVIDNSLQTLADNLMIVGRRGKGRFIDLYVSITGPFTGRRMQLT